MKTLSKSLAAAGLALSMTIPAQAAVLEYESFLDSRQSTTGSDSRAIGAATLSVDTVTERLTFMLTVTRITLDDLWDTLVAAPVGPIHLHNAPAGQTGPVVVPFAFDMQTYSGNDTGFLLEMEDFGYSDAASLSGTGLSFSDFVAQLDAGNFYINVHTDAWNAGEIRGQLASTAPAVPLPATGVLLLAGIGGMAGLRKLRRAA